MSLHDFKPLVTVPSVHDDGDLALYTNGPSGTLIHLDLGDEIITTSDVDLAPLAKAILNAVEPEALVENQKDAEPEPYRPQVGDWVKVADSQMYNRYFRGQTLQVVDPGYRVSAFEVVVRGTDGFSGSIRLKDVTPASDPSSKPQQPSVVDLITRIDTLEAQVAALATQADPTIRVGDTVRVEPNDWNIPAPSATRGRAVLGKVRSVNPDWIRSRYLVEFRSLNNGKPLLIWATRATKVSAK